MMMHRLSDEDYALAIEIANARTKLMEDQQDYAFSEDELDIDVVGGCTEIGVNRWFSFPYAKYTYQTIPEFKKRRHTDKDAGPFSLKGTRNPRGGLLLRPWDKTKGDDPCIACLLSENDRLVTMYGWAWGREVKQQCWWDRCLAMTKNRPGFLMPRELLRDPITLIPLAQAFKDRGNQCPQSLT